ncbi:Xaa-Pro dipeptidase [Ferrimonas kyonanensis]|uniref:Xaa-Pro dipeptidase n=1 Tax=Ferrimonas kyonanensis TaxID=364763 RepID=UPI000404F726|nr:Xaa-Pro dipeptidase [Ferrimonas kyonanensis]
MERLAPLYQAHIAELSRRSDTILAQQGLDGMVIHSGQPLRIFLDDMDYPFKPNPHFKHWLPVTDDPHCVLLIRPGQKPTLLFYRPVDFWHKVPPLPTEFWTEFVDLQVIEKPEQARALLPASLANFAYIGEHPELASEWGLTQINPKPVMDYLHYHRAYKTDYELACMRIASEVAVCGHEAARDAFFGQKSEFDIQLAYLSATQHGENDVPYGNIVALNENSAILHYTKLQKTAPEKMRSFLLDAGASFHGYASDITRTYAFDSQSKFAELVAAMDAHQQALIATMTPGMRYTDLHLAMHQRVAQMLRQFDLAAGSDEALIANGVTAAFFPHGLGHQIGLQVHDVGGFMQDPQGTHLAAPEAHPALRCTRVIEPGMVVTIEPGLYIIDTLLDGLKDEASSMLNRTGIDALRPYGGVRIEDDVVIHADRIENLTRDLGLA